MAKSLVVIGVINPGLVSLARLDLVASSLASDSAKSSRSALVYDPVAVAGVSQALGASSQ